MNAHFPDRGTVETALRLASRAPSVHNTQPWRWRVGETSLHLYCDPTLQLPHTDPDGRDMILSCGAALNHCITGLAATGWQAKVNRLPNFYDPNHLAAIQVSPHPAGQLDIMLAAAIPRRRTDRRHYSFWPVAGGDIALMAARAARAGVALRQVDATDKLNKIVAESVWNHAADADYLAELTAWSGRHASDDGIPAHSTPVPDRTAPMPGRLFSRPQLRMPSGATPDVENAAVLALGTMTDDKLAWLRTGEATSIVLLTATALGLASCPITEPLEIAETREAVRADVFGANGYPQMLLRVGWAPIDADPLPSTPRRELDDFVEWIAESEQAVGQ
ncbi:Acg family FMN-binding oxidoreductase [Mycobacterium vicinigordonae]|uniref:Nitroreductase family protein n=1 Tax=Mycobacterium vicinigordonae TaxID=1719132 RepID=A0A7D6IJT8_9MYCO|nr:nitroreductase family protein [Mycobacterium vicinigordonae]QLL05680.1 nitroreductase family protein [Mycobacterium vicinigordonae]